MLEALNLFKAYNGRPVIQGFSARLQDGGHTCLMGPSGCGKTTLLRLLMGLTAPDHGEVRIPAGTRFSAVFQEDRLLEQMTAAANVCLATRATRAEAEALLGELEIPAESLARPVGAFSGGMKRRVALCRALLADYDALMLDEPYKGLDAGLRGRVMKLVARRAAGRTVLLVTHDPAEASGFEVINLSPVPEFQKLRPADNS